jgi:hypothetical protein
MTVRWFIFDTLQEPDRKHVRVSKRSSQSPAELLSLRADHLNRYWGSVVVQTCRQKIQRSFGTVVCEEIDAYHILRARQKNVVMVQDDSSLRNLFRPKMNSPVFWFQESGETWRFWILWLANERSMSLPSGTGVLKDPKAEQMTILPGCRCGARLWHACTL